MRKKNIKCDYCPLPAFLGIKATMSDQLSREASKKQLQEIKEFFRTERERLKPLFGYMFWEFAASGAKTPPESFLSDGMSLTLDQADDEVQASFMASYVQIWDNCQDFNAASRFVAEALGMSADELIQCRQNWQDIT
jgi:hypothetical protein